MASKQIHELSYRLTLNNRDFAQKMNATTAEVRKANSVIKAAAKPTELLAIERRKLQNLVSKGLISEKQYRHALERTADRLGVLTMRMRAASAARKAFNAAALAGGAAVTAMAFNIRSQLSEVDELAKFARQIDLPIEQLTRFQFVAQKASGIARNEFNNAMGAMVRRVSEAAAGSGEARAALAALGLDAEKLAGVRTDVKFLMIADALKGVEDQTKRNELAYDLFGRQGQKLLNTLTLGSEAIKEQGKQADSLGAAISEIEANQIEAANDAMTDLQTAWKGLGRELTITLVPALKATVELVKDFLKARQAFGYAAASDVDKRRFNGEMVTDDGRTLNPVQMSPGAAATRDRLAQQERDRAARRASGEEATPMGALEREKRAKGVLQGLLSAAKGLPGMVSGAGSSLLNQGQEDQKRAVMAIGKLFGNAGTNLTRGFIDASRQRAEQSGGGSGTAAGVFGPADSLTAGSSEAFRFLNRMGQEIPQQQLKEQKETNTKLGQLVDQFTAWVEFSQADRDKAADALFGNPT